MEKFPKVKDYTHCGAIHIVRKIFQKNISYPLIETQKYFYQGTKKLVFRKICIHPKGADLTFYKKIMIRNKLYSKALEIGYTTIF